VRCGESAKDANNDPTTIDLDTDARIAVNLAALARPVLPAHY
jgi:hypothetical protein